MSEWREEQNNDIYISPVVRLVKQNLHQNYKVQENDPSGMKILMKYRRDLVLKKGLLYRKFQLKNQSDVVFQFVLPKPFPKKTVGNGPNVSSPISILLGQNVGWHPHTY